MPVVEWIKEKGEKRRERREGERRRYWKWTVKGKEEFRERNRCGRKKERGMG